MSAPIEYQVDDGIARVELDRPGAFNAINGALAAGLESTMRRLRLDEAVRAVILTGAGEAFCGGGDLKEFYTLEDTSPGDAIHPVASDFHEAIREIREMPKVVIAAINGPAAGGGFSLALACDLRVMSGDAFLRLAYTAHGLSIDGGGTWTLPRLVGMATALEIALLDERIGAERAKKLGLVHRVVDGEVLDAAATELAEKAADMPLGSIGRTKQLLNRSFDRGLGAQLDAERAELTAQANTREGTEGIESFLEKRAPDFRNRNGGTQ